MQNRGLRAVWAGLNSRNAPHDFRPPTDRHPGVTERAGRQERAERHGSVAISRQPTHGRQRARASLGRERETACSSLGGEELVQDQNGHARYDGDERRRPSFRCEVDLEHQGHHKEQQIAHRHGNTWHDRPRRAVLYQPRGSAGRPPASTRAASEKGSSGFGAGSFPQIGRVWRRARRGPAGRPKASTRSSAAQRSPTTRAALQLTRGV